MKVSIEKTEHYTLFSLGNSPADNSAIEELLQRAHELIEQEEIVYFIFDLNPISDLIQTLIDGLQAITESLVLKGGLLINVHNEPSMLARFEDQQLVMVPKVEEAIEYIYMDQLEKQFLGDSEE
jgi:hypothetical protein